MSATNFSSAKALKKLFTVSTFMLLTAIGTNANAYGQTKCYSDYWGNFICTDSGSGYRTSTTTDYWGNDVTSDNYGNRMSCYWDYWNNYICNY
jgi:hypothetical protein